MTKFSICIPAYKRANYLERLLESIVIQSYKDFEVIISDDSPDNSVLNILQNYKNLSIRYLKNTPALGTPANWNFAISRAKGEWIKIMHDDDWFSSTESLAYFASLTKKNCKFIFSGYTNRFEDGKFEAMEFPSSKKSSVIQNPLLLLAKNHIGPPSVTLIHHSIAEKYDEAMKWRVDIDFYIRLIYNLKDFCYTQKSLVNVGISSTQVTNDCINIPEVEWPEGKLLLDKFGIKPLSNILVYDAWWRIIRNTKIRDIKQLDILVPGETWPSVLIDIIHRQQRINSSLLNSPLSKIFMTASYLLHLNKIK